MRGARRGIAKAAQTVRSEACRVLYGGPSASPEDASYILARCENCHGFYSASFMERLPTGVTLIEWTRRFKAIRREQP